MAGIPYLLYHLLNKNENAIKVENCIKQFEYIINIYIIGEDSNIFHSLGTVTFDIYIQLLFILYLHFNSKILKYYHQFYFYIRMDFYLI